MSEDGSACGRIVRPGRGCEQRTPERERPPCGARSAWSGERDRGLEPLLIAWKATVLPLHQSRLSGRSITNSMVGAHPRQPETLWGP